MREPREWSRNGCDPGYELRRGAIPRLVAMHRDTGLPVSLDVLSGLSVTSLELLFAEVHREQVERVNIHHPAHCTAAGKVLLAHSPDTVDALVRLDRLHAYTEKTITRADELQNELEAVRGRGLATSCGEYLPQLNEAAVPVFDRSRRVVAAVAVAEFGRHPIRCETEQSLRREAAAISAVLARRRWPDAAAHRSRLHHANSHGRLVT